MCGEQNKKPRALFKTKMMVCRLFVLFSRALRVRSIRLVGFFCCCSSSALYSKLAESYQINFTEYMNRQHLFENKVECKQQAWPFLPGKPKTKNVLKTKTTGFFLYSKYSGASNSTVSNIFRIDRNESNSVCPTGSSWFLDHSFASIYVVQARHLRGYDLIVMRAHSAGV